MMDDTATSHCRTVERIHGNSLPQEIVIILAELDEQVSKATERLRDEHGGSIRMGPVRVHRFPRGLRGMGGGSEDDGRYVVPSAVAIGPYHHGLPHLQEVETVKLAAADRFCADAGCRLDQVYVRIDLVSDVAHFCYAPGDDAVARLTDAEFAAMMLVNGCFLLQFIHSGFVGSQYSSRPGILKDILLLENQVPWLVLEALLQFMPEVDVCRFVADVGEEHFFERKDYKIPQCEGSQFVTGNQVDNAKQQPPLLHLLGHLWYSQIRGVLDAGTELQHDEVCGSSSSLSISAAELDQIGLKLSASTKASSGRFGDMCVKERKMAFGELCLSPVSLNDVSACWLVNMAALEARAGSGDDSDDDDRAVVTSYMSVLAMLMDRKEDVHRLRRKGVLRSVFSNAQTLAFFKELGRRLEPGRRYFIAVNWIDQYVRRSPVRIAVYRFFFNNYRTVAKVMSVAGVLFAIFKAFLEISAHNHLIRPKVKRDV